jgi:hypothetical protein
VLGVIDAPDLRQALAEAPGHRHTGAATAYDAWLPETVDLAPRKESHLFAVVDQRDWRGQVVAGRRLLRRERIVPAGADHG